MKSRAKVLDYFIAGDDEMEPRMIKIRCPNCGYDNNPIPADM